MSWIAAALSADLPKNVAMPNCIQGTDLAIWRSASGKVQAWIDRCPHRGMRLSHGFVRGETLACIYHGWRYGADGGCNHIPAHPALTPPKSIMATAFSTHDDGNLIWVALEDVPTLPHCPDGFAPLRSLHVSMSGDDAAAGLGGSTGAPVFVDELALFIQPRGAGDCMVHAVAKTGSDRKQASANLEALRRRIEGAQHA